MRVVEEEGERVEDEVSFKTKSKHTMKNVL